MKPADCRTGGERVRHSKIETEVRMASLTRFRTLLLVLLAVVVAAPMCGCQARTDMENPRPPAQSPSVEADYPGWEVLQKNGPTSTQLVAGEGAGMVREDMSFLIASPDGTIRILAWYARSGPSSAISSKAWQRLDQLFIGELWKSSSARGLYAQMRDDSPDDALLGAYRSEETSASGQEYWHVGYYSEKRQGESLDWVRGDHLYQYNPATNEWSLLQTDSGSNNAWNTIGPVDR